MPDRHLRWSVLVAVAVVLLVIGVAAAAGGLTVGPPPPPGPLEQPTQDAVDGTAPPTPPPTAPAGPVPAEGGWEIPGWVVRAFDIVGYTVGMLVLLGALGIALYYLVSAPMRPRLVVDRPATQPEGQPVDPDEVQQAVQAGLADIDVGGDPRRAVIACWLRLERIAAAAGTPRMAADTAEDLVVRLLASRQVDDRTLRALAEAYRRARYAPAEVSDRVRVSAREALARLATQLGAPQAAPRER